MGAIGPVRELRDDRERTARAAVPNRPTFLIVALDGTKRDILYDLLHAGELPGLARLLGGRTPAGFPHAHFEQSMLAALPSITIVGWASAFTGVPPAAHGVAGNEFFIREERRLAAPLPGTFESSEPALATYTDDYANDLLAAPTLYERLRARDPTIEIWVSVNQFFRGADRLLVAERSAILGKAYTTARSGTIGDEVESYEERDEEVLRNVLAEIDDADRVPEVLTLYVSSPDSYAHVAEEGPDRALRRVLTGTLDATLGELAATLERRDALANRWVIVVADHGHSAVPADGSTLLAVADDGPPAVLRDIGFRVRPFQLEVDDDADFQAVLAYQGPMAYVYVADRATCPRPGDVCDWRRPPRFHEDVLPVAEAYFQATRRGRHAPRLRGTLDLVLTRRPRPHAEDDLPFAVYVGRGRTVPLADHLRRHPRPTWVALESRLRELAAGRYGERAGDVLLIARNGDGRGPDGRYYFNAGPQRSVHGSPSRQDGEVPLIVAHRGRGAPQIEAALRPLLGRQSLVRQLSDVVLHLAARAD